MMNVDMKVIGGAVVIGLALQCAAEVMGTPLVGQAIAGFVALVGYIYNTCDLKEG